MRFKSFTRFTFGNFCTSEIACCVYKNNTIYTFYPSKNYVMRYLYLYNVPISSFTAEQFGAQLRR